MKVLLLYNEFRSARGGEDKVVENTISLFDTHGVDFRLMRRSSKDLGLGGKIRAFVNGIYSREAYRTVSDVLDRDRPDLVHVHNLYPFFSPSVLVACREAGVPVVMTVHNFGLTCPHWFHFRDGQICEKCSDGNFLWCIRHNCQKNLPESVGYALRADYARRKQLFHDNVTCFVALSDFARERLISAGFSGDRVHVLRNMIDIPEHSADVRHGEYVAFAGRLSPEKGADVLLESARLLTRVPFEYAGGGPLLDRLKSSASSNVRFRGLLDAQELELFYRSARILVVPSVWYEMCPTTILEAMARGLPVVTSRLGGLPELVQDGTTGSVSRVADPVDLAEKIVALWDDPDHCVQMGVAGREWVTQECDQHVHFERLMAVYDDAISRASRARV